MAGDIHDNFDNLWRWLSHSTNSIFLLDGLHGMKDLLIPSVRELPPSEGLSKTEEDDVCSLERIIESKCLKIISFEFHYLRKFKYLKLLRYN